LGSYFTSFTNGLSFTTGLALTSGSFTTLIFFSTGLVSAFFATGFFLVKSDILCIGVLAFGLASGALTVERDRHVPFPRSSRGRRICQSLSSFASRWRSNALMAFSIACFRSSVDWYGNLKGLISRKTLSVSCHLSASGDERFAILGSSSRMLACEVRHVSASAASVAGCLARRWMTGTRRALSTASWLLLGCDVGGGPLCMGEPRLLIGEPSLEGARC
jgi:hypothetical protein